MFDGLIGNLTAATAQVFVVAAVGSVLPALLRVRHARGRLIYFHFLLAACLALPLVEPWRHPIVTIGVNQSEQAPEMRIWLIPQMLVGVLALGILARGLWLLAGLWRIRRYRIHATPLYPVPETVEAASAVTHADALFCLSTDTPGPVTLGWLTPVVLLPESFLHLEEEAQCGVACHELLHVRRHDWLVTLFEETIGALLWFNPGIWMLLSQTRLAREQLVDSEVVKLTAAKESYIEALLAIARGRSVLDLAPAPLFLRRRHLTKRMHSLLKEVPASNLQLVYSFSSMVAILTIAAWFASSAFPLMGTPRMEYQTPAPPVLSINQTTTVPAPQDLKPHSLDAQVHAEAPAPPDANSPRFGVPQIPATPADRANALYLLERAKQNSKLHIPNTPPFELRVTFQTWGTKAPGSILYTGSGELTESWRSGQNWRWTAKLGSYSQVQLGNNGMIRGLTPTAVTPLRVQMLRAAIFWAARGTPASSQIRTSSGQMNGTQVTCLLFARIPVSTNERVWEEEEYCLDTEAGVLRSYSPVPGSRAAYGYSKNRLFHGRREADQITLYEGGTQVLDAQLEFSDLGDTNPIDQWENTQARAVVLNHARQTIFVGPNSVSGHVVIHASFDATGKAIEAELTSATDQDSAARILESIHQGAYHRANSFDRRGIPQTEVYLDFTER
jgi:beta-lactamase regulating signal transducer with metallopeptidase domain